MLWTLFLLSLLGFLLENTRAATAEQWRHKVIYQLMTDRFATTDGSKPFCDIDARDYCHGTFQGIIRKLDYLQDLGVDAIWISPIQENFPQGYHGYWASSLYRVNPYFGSADDVKALTREAHKRGMLVMADVVANHMGFSESWANISQFDPFNDPSHYHGCDGCHPDDCWVFDYSNETQCLYCRLFGLPDLNQSNPYVNETLLDWIDDMVHEYDFDGLRIDTVPYVHKWFWGNFTQRAGVYTMGEVADGRIDWVSSFQGYVDGLLNFPMYYTVMSAFKSGGSMKDMSSVWRRETGADFYPDCGNGTNGNNTNQTTLFYDYEFTPNSYNAHSRRLLQDDGYPSGGYGNSTVLYGSGFFKDMGLNANFLENHDFGRFLDEFPNYAAYRNALVWLLGAEGIPILYYGSEQGYNGGHEPYCREALWDSEYKTDNAWQGLFRFIQRMLTFRRESQYYLFPHSEMYVDDNVYVFARGQVVFAVTARGNATANLKRIPWKVGTRVCNVLSDGNDCFYVDESGWANFTIGLEPVIYSAIMWPWLGQGKTFIVTFAVFYTLLGVFLVFITLAAWRFYVLIKKKPAPLRGRGGFNRLTEGEDEVEEEGLISDRKHTTRGSGQRDGDVDLSRRW